MSLIDTHCHYNLEPLAADWKTHWAKAQTYGVVASLVVGTDRESNELSLQIAAAAPHLFATLGFHPGTYDEKVAELQQNGISLTAIKTELESLITTDIAWLDECLSRSPQKVIAIGETGLDTFHFDPSDQTINQLKIDLQKQAFIAQIDLANRYTLPLILHVRDKQTTAYHETLQLVKTHYHFHRPFILHCASGPLDYIQAAIKLGAYVGFDGNLTYKNNQTLLEIFHQTPTNHRLLETDAPFLPPQPHRGKTCEPWMISLTAEYCQTQLGVEIDQFAQNAMECFSLPENAYL